MNTTTQSELHTALRAWAKGIYPTEAAVELLIRTGLASTGDTWVQPGEDPGWWWIDFEGLAGALNEGTPHSGGERRLLSIAASLGGYSPEGFRLADALPVVLPGGIRSHTVSLAALALLKIVCWQDRHYEAPRKDAHDLQMILLHYLAAGNESRLWNEFVEWTQQEDFDYERAGPRMLGRDISQLLSPDGLAQVARIISDQTHPDSSGRLPMEMNPADPDRAIAWLDALVHAMHE